jgi:hypothetical protein
VAKEKKTRKGIFKNAGVKLSEEQQDFELSVLNPLGKAPGLGKFSTNNQKKNSYLLGSGTRNATI